MGRALRETAAGVAVFGRTPIVFRLGHWSMSLDIGSATVAASVGIGRAAIAAGVLAAAPAVAILASGFGLRGHNRALRGGSGGNGGHRDFGSLRIFQSGRGHGCGRGNLGRDFADSGNNERRGRTAARDGGLDNEHGHVRTIRGGGSADKFGGFGWKLRKSDSGDRFAGRLGLGGRERVGNRLRSQGGADDR